MPKSAAAAEPGVAGSNYPVIKDKAAIQAADDFKSKYELMKRLGDEIDAHKETVLKALAGAAKGMFGNRIVSAKEYEGVEPTDNVMITKDMIGQVIEGKAGRKGYWRIWVR